MTSIDYPSLLEEAMLDVFKKALKHVMNHGFEREQSFYISFRTNYPGIVASQKILNRYPEEITIILQHQYRDLIVQDDHFSVSISFGGLQENIVVPFDAMTSFVDPDSSFSLQFKRKNINAESNILTEQDQEKASPESSNNSSIPMGKVIAFEKFRKK